VSQIEVFPGLNGFFQPPNPPFGRYVSNTFFSPTGWQNSGDERLDYGVLLLNQAVGQNVGAFGFSTYSTTDLMAANANLSGYPLRSPDSTEPQGRQWYGASKVAKVENSFVYYQLRTQAGDSGSCVYRNIGNQSFAMAIHTGFNGTIDRGVRIIPPVYANLQKWSMLHA
jgi:V8-like Glu-specific endopeptidase